MQISDFPKAPAAPDKHLVRLRKNYGGVMTGEIAAFDRGTLVHLIKHDAAEVPDAASIAAIEKHHAEAKAAAQSPGQKQINRIEK